MNDHGYFERPGDSGVITKVPLGLMDKGRLLKFRSEVVGAYKPRNFRDEAPAPAAKKVRLSTIVGGTAEAEVDVLSPERISDMFT
eukprot:651694-Alexandrium_andersonii.AAC.1